MTLSVEHMETLPDFFRDIDDPRRKAGRRRALPSVLALATAAVLCGMRGYRAIREWVDDLKPSELRRVRFRDGRHERPGEWVVRDVLIRVNPGQLDAALRASQDAHGGGRDTALAIDGRTMRANFRNDLRLVGKEIEAMFLRQSQAVAESVRRIMTGLSRCVQRDRPGRSYERRSKQLRSRWTGQTAA